MGLPFAEDLPHPKLRGSDSITFDPLGVAAILGNPRADLSAARLYVQADRATFRWPHGTMIGGALTPVSTLVSHLAQYESIHPAVAMCTKDEIAISVISNTVFRELRINVENLWMRDVLNFRPSHEKGVINSVTGTGGGRAANDIAIVLAKDVFEPGALSFDSPNRWAVRVRKLIINLTAWTTGLLICVGLVFSVLTGDFWGVALFACYLGHWTVNTAISWTYLVKTVCPSIRQDDTTRFMIHERPPDIGGTVVFKGNQTDIETWYRTTLQFRHGFWTDSLHWLWILTGTMSAIASVACMVNMTGTFQLVFLAVLTWSSIAELWVTQCARRIQKLVRNEAAMGKVVLLTDNKTRTEAITRATLAAGNDCSLKGLDWVGLKLLPPSPIFVNYQKLLNTLSADVHEAPEAAMHTFLQDCNVSEQSVKNKFFLERILTEIRDVLDEVQRADKNAEGGEEKPESKDSRTVA